MSNESARISVEILPLPATIHPMSVPTLPPELERAIFEICALSRPLSIPTLMLVAWRVKLWVEPFLYRIFLSSGVELIQGLPRFDDETLIPLLPSKPTSFFKDSVRHLLMCGTEEHLENSILSACSKVENLWIVSDADRTGNLYHLIRNLPLKRLHCSIADLFSSTQPDFTLPLFSKITHLELIDYPAVVDLKMWSGIAFIPNLTHLSFNSRNFIPLSLGLLDTCKALRVLVFLTPTLRSGETVANHQDGEKLVRDTRFVVMRCREYAKDWQTGAHIGLDHWTRAEDFIAKRRSGEIDVLHNVIEEDASETIP
ncbi:hypothetical protein DFH09DRAFT_1168002 [Mycena vulgaris]|nr:hypothetical protein DFH09DRAFT_1168002 [Mycena vulgaris]